MCINDQRSRGGSTEMREQVREEGKNKAGAVTRG